MSVSFFDLMKYARTGIATPDMTGFDKLRAKAAFGGYPVSTITGVPPISFKADGKPLTAWSIAGNGQQTGTPTPDAPIMPEFVGVRTGNLVDPSALRPGYLNTAGFVNAQDGTRLEFTSDFIPVSSNGYTWSLSEDWGDREGWVARVYYDSGKNMIGSRLGGITGEKSFSFSVPSEASYVRIAWRSYGTIALSLSTGVNELHYEPYGYKIPITCAGQTVPVYLGQTQTVRRVKKLVLTGAEYWMIWNGNYFSSVIDRKGKISDIVCSHFINSPAAGISYSQIASSGLKIAAVAVPFVSDVAGLKQWLADEYAAGHPVTVWYVPKEPETAIVNEPLAKIGTYADELHSTDAGVTIPTVRGSNTLTVDTTLQPSSMTITGNIKAI